MSDFISPGGAGPRPGPVAALPRLEHASLAIPPARLGCRLGKQTTDQSLPLCTLRRSTS